MVCVCKHFILMHDCSYCKKQTPTESYWQEMELRGNNQ